MFQLQFICIATLKGLVCSGLLVWYLKQNYVSFWKKIFLFYFTLDAEISPEERFKLYYVFKGPKKERKNKKLYYVYATSVNAKDDGIKQTEYRPQGMGYDWPESYRKANNLYYDLIFLEQGTTLYAQHHYEYKDIARGCYTRVLSA